jgi:competence protein ComEC
LWGWWCVWWVGVLGLGWGVWGVLAWGCASLFEWAALTDACRDADIVVSDRRLPRGCTPRWLKLDSAALRQTGGLAVYLGNEPWVDSVANRIGDHPWSQFAPTPRSTRQARFPTGR